MPASTIASTPKLDSLITPETLAERLGVKISTLAEWRLTGAGPDFIRIGKTSRYLPEDVDAWLVSQRRSSTAEERP